MSTRDEAIAQAQRNAMMDPDNAVDGCWIIACIGGEGCNLLAPTDEQQNVCPNCERTWLPPQTDA